MKTIIENTRFGSITISGSIYLHDVVICLDGHVRRRTKELSTARFGTSHIISLEEAKDIFETGAKQLIVGTGQTGYVKLSVEAAAYLRHNGCSARLHPTPQAIKVWNETDGAVIGLFHVTC